MYICFLALLGMPSNYKKTLFPFGTVWTQFVIFVISIFNLDYAFHTNLYVKLAYEKYIFN